MFLSAAKSHAGATESADLVRSALNPTDSPILGAESVY
jgi:hypothetical protein